MPSFKKYMKFENLKNLTLNNWIIHSDFECVIDPITKEHSFISGGYYLECRNNKFSKKIQKFYDLKEYIISLVKELIYIDDIESNYLQMKLIILLFIKKNLIMLRFVNIVNANSTIHIMIDILFYTKFVIKKN